MDETRKKLAVICSTDYSTYPVGGMMSFVKDSAPMLTKSFDVDFWGIDVGADVSSFVSNGKTFPFRSFSSILTRKKYIPNIVRVVWDLYRMRRVILAEDYDGIYFHGIPLNLGFPGKIRPKRINHVHGLTNPFAHLSTSWLRNWLPAHLYAAYRRRIVRQSDLILLAADHVGIEAFRLENPRAGRIEKIENFCDNSLFGAEAEPINRAEQDLLPGCRLILHVGRFTHQKDPLLALRAFSEVVQSDIGNSKTYLIMIGDGPLLEEGKELADALGVADSVRFLGNQTREIIARWLASADLYLYTSWANGYPISLAEAAQSGLPIVSTAVTGVHDLVRPGLNGSLVASRKPQDFVLPILDAIEKSEAYGRASRDLAEKYTPDRVLTHLIKEISNVL